MTHEGQNVTFLRKSPLGALWTVHKPRNGHQQRFHRFSSHCFDAEECLLPKREPRKSPKSGSFCLSRNTWHCTGRALRMGSTEFPCKRHHDSSSPFCHGLPSCETKLKRSQSVRLFNEFDTGLVKLPQI